MKRKINISSKDTAHWKPIAYINTRQYLKTDRVIKCPPMHDINTVLKYVYLLTLITEEQLTVYITDAIVTKYGSHICLGEQISLGKCVWGTHSPGEHVSP